MLTLSTPSVEALTSPQAVQVVAAALAVRPFPPRIRFKVDPSLGGISLAAPDLRHPLLSLPAMLLFVHALSPVISRCPHRNAVVGSWAEHSSEISVPLLSVDEQTAAQVVEDVEGALLVADRVLGRCTYLAGTGQASVADYAWAAWTEAAVAEIGESLELGLNVQRWFRVVTEQAPYLTAKSVLAAGPCREISLGIK